MSPETEHPPRVTIIGYAFKSLDPQQTEQVEAHLETCPDCLALVALYQAKANKMHVANPEVQPPAEPQERLAWNASPTIPAKARRRAFPFGLDWLHVVLGVVALVLLIANLLQLNQARILRDDQNDLLRTIQANQVINALASEPGIQMVAISGPNGQGTLLYEKSGTAGVLFLRNLPKLDSSQTYQAWFIQASGAPLSAGAFHANAGTPFASVLLNAEQPLKSYTAINVTVEPVAGSTSPTSTPILVVKF